MQGDWDPMQNDLASMQVVTFPCIEAGCRTA